MNNRPLFWPVLLLTFSFFCNANICVAGSPTAQVKNMLDAVMAVQNDARLAGDENKELRRTAIKEIISANIDFDAMARYALGDFWKPLSQAEQMEFTHIFKDLFQDSYSRLVLNFIKQETIQYNREEVQNKNASVMTTIVRTNDEIFADYALTQSGDNWLVIDIAVDDVSIADNYRKAFARVIGRQSYAVLLDKMRLQQRAIKDQNAENKPQ
jgi:phospholipid transport system substrate-binding protein